MAATPVSAQITLPALGTIILNVGVAPFQYAPTDAHLFYPAFLNGSTLYNPAQGGLGAATAGVNGLQFIYTSVSTDAGNLSPGQADATNLYVPMVQFAGGTVNSFGVFEYKSI